MLFNSLQFALFFPVVTLLYFLLRGNTRVAMLLGASCLFYMAFVPKYILILFLLILVDYSAGLLIEKAQGARRKLLLSASLCANAGMLGVFKYFNFFNANLAEAFHWMGWNYPISGLSLLLPIGLSFHTFQSMSYTIEVYRGNLKAERSLLHFALYVLFYPQLVAGPIERPQNLLHQFHEEHRFSWSNLRAGLKMMAIGLFKKVIIADRIALLVNTAYAHPEQATGLQLLLATYFFAIQIYCDFSGYSDIARGAARVMGIDLMRNFNQPYLASSLDDFWRRWHISLSTWFRDYVYFPMGGNRVSARRLCLNVLVVFLVSGLWHGANWTFVAWGALHGLGFMACILTRQIRSKTAAALGYQGSAFSKFLGMFLTFNYVSFAWIFFRAPDLSQAFTILRRIFSDLSAPIHHLHPGLSFEQFVISLGLIVALLAAELLHRHPPRWVSNAMELKWVRWSAYYLFAVAFAVLALLSPQQTAQTFIYFQF
jgi:D-alanyl-lipoteichoic acid acyltransferase DltB (MBOAT superfamily)